ncbi:MAG: FAD-dependent thymidylate synthase [Oscillospiraceae bacterium]|jgi:thymidylate synthase (FAD)|nr:FAD-dependent thymidylate synthase [Oscillospiraceae bacterium]
MAKVTLITYTPSPDQLIAQSARLCYSSASIEGIHQGLTPEKTASMVGMLAEMGHDSPTEHASFTFGIEGVSRSFLAQITRHRIASYSVKSQRYVNEKDFEFVIPPEIDAIPQARKEFLAAMEDDRRRYETLSQLLWEKHKKELMESGMTEKKAASAARKMANEDARFVLPNACETKMICTFNARSLNHFFSLRCCNRAQWEIREVATEMLRLARKAAPELFQHAGPSCVRGACSEGKMSCGKAREVREFFSNLGKES